MSSYVLVGTRRKWALAVVAGDTNLGFEDWELAQGGSGPRPRRALLHKPPMMDERNTGIFEFYDVNYQHPMEVVPQSTSGNVEITLGDTLFTLHHLDRADLIRALLHDFHYSPERGGPTHDD